MNSKSARCDIQSVVHCLLDTSLSVFVAIKIAETFIWLRDAVLQFSFCSTSAYVEH